MSFDTFTTDDGDLLMNVINKAKLLLYQCADALYYTVILTAN